MQQSLLDNPLRAHQNMVREQIMRDRALEDTRSQARWNKKLADRGLTNSTTPQGIGCARIGKSLYDITADFYSNAADVATALDYLNKKPIEISPEKPVIIFPRAIEFDLALSVAKDTLAKLRWSGEVEAEDFDADLDGNIKMLVSGMDDEAADFYIKTMTANMRAWFNRSPNDQWSVKRLNVRAEQGMCGAKKGRLSDAEVRDACHITLGLNRHQNRWVESVALHSKIIGKKGSARESCTSHQHKRWKRKEEDKVAWAVSQIVTDGIVSFPLSDVLNTIPKRVAEQYALSIGMEKSAAGCESASVICTLDSHWHANPEKGRCSWDGQTPDDGSKLISKKWARVRAMLAKKDIQLAGFWTKESNGDATPHINFLILFPPGTADTVRKAFARHFEHNKTHAMRWEIICTTPGKNGKLSSFASYASKYFRKFFQENPDDATIDEAAWASCWGIRRYGFFGLPSLTIWRELRRKEAPKICETRLEKAWEAARNGNAEEWIKQCGGLCEKRSLRPLQAWREAVAGCASKQVIGVKEMEIGTMSMFGTKSEWVLEGREKRNGRNKGSTYTRVCRVRRLITVVTVKGFARDCDSDTKRLRTRTPGRWAIKAKTAACGAEIEKVTLNVNLPRGVHGTPENPVIFDPHRPPNLH